ncbi:MAG: hypothetical protein ACREQ5_22365, partial [Candidatus Dormibacteria bacterium]
MTGPTTPVFINTYQMKVTPSSPVWAWGNWYQSDAYAIGEHDLAQLAFSTGLLQTQPHLPVMQSEFQAGWLEEPGEIFPRPADPANTTLALGTLLAMGAHGVIHFPAQDTLYPAGMEAPFANAFYAWDAALALDGSANPRYAPVARFGAVVTRYGAALAQSHLVPDAAIAYLTSAFVPARTSNATVAEIAARTIEAQRRCRLAGRTCRLVDLRFADDATLARTPLLIVPMPYPATVEAAGGWDPAALATLQRYVDRGGRVVVLGAPPLGLRGERDLPADAGPPAIFPSDEPTDGAAFDANERVPLAVLADDVTNHPRFIVAVNPTTSAISITDARLAVGGRSLPLPELDLPPRDARIFPVELAADDRSVRLADDRQAAPPEQPATIVTRADALPIRAGDPASDDPAERPLDFASTALATFGSPPSDAANARLLDV